MKKTMTLTLTTLALGAAFTLTACGSPASTAPASSAPPAATAPVAAPQNTAAALPAGTVLLSVNPEIEMDYDDGGKVLALNGRNEDARAVLAGYTGYEGRPCADVVSELVGKINAGGYFDETIGGQEKNIILRLEHGSNAPEGFLDGLAEAARGTVESEQIGSRTMTLDDDDLDDAYADKGYINAGAAEELLSAQLGRDDLQFVEREYDLDDGEYEVAFVANGIEYEFEVDARTGKVTEMEAEGRDSWDDHWDDDLDDDWDDAYDDLDDQYDDDWDDAYDDLDDQYDDDWDDAYDDLDDQYDDWDDDHDDDWDDDHDDDWDDDHDDDWDDTYDDLDDQYDDDWDDDGDDWDDDDDDHDDDDWDDNDD